jgi:hypothetical protein
MRWWCVAVLVAPLALAGGCRDQRPPPRRRVTPDAPVATRRPGPAVAAPRAVPVTFAQRAFDRQHQAALQRIVGALDKLYRDSVALQARGVQEPAFREQWPVAREGLLTRAGRMRAQVLAVDPLSDRSWAAARASALLRYLTVKLPDAIRESWRSRPSGAFTTWRSDFRLIWNRLRRYVEGLSKNASRPRSKDTR